MVHIKTALEAALCAFKVGCILCSAFLCRAGGMAGRVRNLAHREKMRHKGVLSFFGLGNLKIRPKIFPKSGTGFRRSAQEYTTPIFFTGRKILSPI